MADQYRWKKGRWELGPAALEDMRKMARSGALASDQNVSKDGGKTWACASEFSEIWEAQAADETLQSPDPASYQQFWDEELKIDGEPVSVPIGNGPVLLRSARRDEGLALAGFITATAALVLIAGMVLMWVFQLGSGDWGVPSSFVLLVAAATGLALSAVAIARRKGGVAKAGLVNGLCGSLLGIATFIGAILSRQPYDNQLPVRPSSADHGSKDDEQSARSTPPLLDSTKYKVRAVLVDTDQKPVPLESLMIYASPKSIVQKEISLAISQHEKEINKWGERRQSLQAHLEKTKAKLNAEEASFAAEYEELRPKQGDQDVLALRNPLKELSKARASKSIADEWYQKTLTERIEPLKDEIAKTEHAIADTWSNESKVQAGFRDRVFSAVNGVSNSNKKRWKTGKDGFVSVEVPAAEPWTVWAVAEHEKYLGKNIVWNSTSQVTRSGNSSSSGTIESTDIVQKKQVRWLLDIPEELDENKLLSLDLETALDSQVLSIESSNNGSCLRKRRASE